MRYEVLESSTIARSPHQSNDDRMLATENFVAIVDGSSRKTETLADVDETEHLAADIVAAIVESFDATLPIGVFAEKCYVDLARWLQAPDASHAAATFVGVNLIRNELWRIGSGGAMIDREVLWLPFDEYESHTAAVRAIYNLSLLYEGSIQEADLLTSDPGRGVILPVLRREPFFRNLPGPSHATAAALDGLHQVDPGLMQTAKLGLGEHEVVLVSDGYPVVKPTLGEAETYLKKLLSEDPAMLHIHPATKGLQVGANSYDDRSYVRISTESGNRS